MMIVKADKEPSTDEKSFVVYKVIRTIITSGVSPIPRNYELFYELLSGQNSALSRDILALPQNPEQRTLDKIGKKHNLPSFSNSAAANVATATAELINKLNARLLRGISNIDAAQTALARMKLSDNSLAPILKELMADHKELQKILVKEIENLGQIDIVDDSIAAVATRDTLTGLPNRLLFGEKLAELYHDGKLQTNASLILANIDHFRVVNEKHGLVQANKALCRISVLLKRRIKSHDFLARISGNEFAIILKDVPQNNAAIIAERLRLAVKKIRISPTELLTLSFGVGENSGTTTAAEFFGRAELALLASRTGPRDCVSVFDKEVARRSRQAYLMHLKADERLSRTLA